MKSFQFCTCFFSVVPLSEQHSDQVPRSIATSMSKKNLLKRLIKMFFRSFLLAKASRKETFGCFLVRLVLARL